MAALSAQSIVKLLFTRGGLALLIVALGALALLLIAVRAGPSSEAHGGTVLGIDMDAFNGATEDGAGPASCADNVDNGVADGFDGGDPDCALADTGRGGSFNGGTLGEIDPCVSVPNATGNV